MHKTQALQLEDMLSFLRMMLKFQDVVRAIDLPRQVTRENDVEHSYHLAMMAWYLNSSGGLGYDTDRLLRYALVHDLPEIYAGDVHALDTSGRQGKHQREAAALDQIEAALLPGQDLTQTIRQYEHQSDPEATFIYALDKLMPMVMIYLNNGFTWHRENLSLERLHANKQSKVAVSEPVLHLYNQLKAELDRQPHLFPQK